MGEVGEAIVRAIGRTVAMHHKELGISDTQFWIGAGILGIGGFAVAAWIDFLEKKTKGTK